MKKDIKLEKAYTDGKSRCKCGHTQTMLPTTKNCICNHCGNTIENKSIARFRYMFYKTKEEN